MEDQEIRNSKQTQTSSCLQNEDRVVLLPNLNSRRLKQNDQILRELLSLKVEILNQSVTSIEKTLKRAIKIFINSSNEVFSEQKVILSSLKLIALVLHKTGFQDNFVKQMLSLRFVGAFLRLDIKKITEMNDLAENSLCLILHQIVFLNLLQDSHHKNLTNMLKTFLSNVLELNLNRKGVFQIFKVIEKLQDQKIIIKVDYTKHKILDKIKTHIRTFKDKSVPFYEISFRILLRIQSFEEIYDFLINLDEERKRQIIQIFFGTVAKSKVDISQRMFMRIADDHIFKNLEPPSVSLFELIKQGVESMNIISLINLAERGFINNLLDQWKMFAANQCVHKLIIILKQIQTRFSGTIMSEAINDIFKIVIPDLVSKYN